MTAKIVKERTLPCTFEQLNALRPLRPIRSDGDFDRARAVAERLAVLDRRTKEQDEYLETLSILMEAYERTSSPIDTDDLDQARALTRARLAAAPTPRLWREGHTKEDPAWARGLNDARRGELRDLFCSPANRAYPRLLPRG